MTVHKKRWIASLLIIVSFVPDIGIKYSMMGFNWTLYRTVAALLFVGYLFSHGFAIQFRRRDYFSRWVLFLAFWVADGVVLMAVSRYSDYHHGFLELLSLSNGLIVLLVMSSVCADRRALDFMLRALFLTLNVFILIGYAEILTGSHLPTSMFNDTARQLDILDYHVNPYMATGICYNVNDFSAMLTSMLPCVVLLGRKWRWVAALDILSVGLINFVNDANICLLAMAIGICCHVLFILPKRSIKRLFKWLIGFAVTIVVIVVALQVRRGSWGAGPLGVVSVQILNFNRSTGSLYARFNMYWSAVVEFLKSGLLGWGPASFTNYFLLNPSASHLTNPHCYPLEILFQYGVFVLCAFVALVLSLMRGAVKLYRDQRMLGGLKYLTALEFLIIYLIVSFAPSSYLQYAYQWAILGICCCVLQRADEWDKLLK